MEKEKAIEIFNKWMDCKDAYQADPSCDGNCFSCEYYASAEEEKEAMQMAISALEKQEEDRWIPVTERLPEIKHHIDDEHFSDEVLVTEWFNGFKKTRIGNFDTRTGWWNDEKGCGNILAVCRGDRKTAYGRRWRYADGFCDKGERKE